MLTFLFSPVRFFELRLERPQGWGIPLALPAICGVLQFSAALMFATKNEPVLKGALSDLAVSRVPPAHVFAFLTLFGYPLTYGLAVLALIAFDVLLNDSGQTRRLGQFAGLCFLSQIPYCAFMVVVAAVWTPETLSFPPGASLQEVQAAVSRYREATLEAPLLSTARLLSCYSILWLCVMLAISLKVVTRLRMVATFAAGTFLAVLLGGIAMFIASS